MTRPARASAHRPAAALAVFAAAACAGSGPVDPEGSDRPSGPEAAADSAAVGTAAPRAAAPATSGLSTGEDSAAGPPAGPRPVLRYAPGDPRLRTAGFFFDTRIAEAQGPDGRIYTLFGYAVGPTVSLGAMVKLKPTEVSRPGAEPATERPFVGRASLRVGAGSLGLVFEEDFVPGIAPLEVSPPPGARRGGGVAARAAGFGPFRWIEAELPAAVWFPDTSTPVVLEFRDERDGRGIRLPARDAFEVRILDAPPPGDGR